MNDTGFENFNRTLENRAKIKKTDPNLLEDIDESNKWSMGRMKDDKNDDEAMFVGDDLTWSYVINAFDAYKHSYLTRSSNIRNDTARPKRSAKGNALTHILVSTIL